MSIAQDLDPELRDRWVAALRGGKYAQGRGQLRNKAEQFCCLGVLCDLLEPNGWEATKIGFYTHSGMSGYLPTALAEQAKIPLRDQEYLAEMNDLGASFGEIADRIEGKT